jgi:hypothetical protein
VPSSGGGRAVQASLFHSAAQWPARDLSATELATYFGGERRHEEWQDGRLLSFFQQSPEGEARHIALRAKELAVDRPHGHLLRSGQHLTPDETALTSTCWMGGVFHSMLTQGHVSFNRVLSTQRSYLGLMRSNGLRVFVDSPHGREGRDGWQLLGLGLLTALTLLMAVGEGLLQAWCLPVWGAGRCASLQWLPLAPAGLLVLAALGQAWSWRLPRGVEPGDESFLTVQRSGVRRPRPAGSRVARPPAQGGSHGQP